MNKVCAQCRHFVSPEMGISHCNVRAEVFNFPCGKSLTLKIERHPNDSAETCKLYDEVIPF